MDRWLTAIEADTTDQPLARKVVTNKPADLLDSVIDENGTQIGDLDYLHRAYPSYCDPRTVAGSGDPGATTTFKPQLKPLDAADYPGIEFSPHQWQRLQNTVPDGVADWTQPGIGHTPSLAWLDYTHGPGGQPLDRPEKTEGLTTRSKAGTTQRDSAICPCTPHARLWRRRSARKPLIQHSANRDRCGGCAALTVLVGPSRLR